MSFKEKNPQKLINYLFQWNCRLLCCMLDLS